MSADEKNVEQSVDAKLLRVLQKLDEIIVQNAKVAQTAYGRNGCVYLSGKISPGASSTYYRKDVAQKLRDAGFHTLDPMRGKQKQGTKWSDLNPAVSLKRCYQLPSVFPLEER